MSLSRSAAPVVIRVREVLADLGVDADADDATIYSALLMAIRSVADGETEDVRPYASEDSAVARRLSTGWFRRPAPYLPQSRFASDAAPPEAMSVTSTFVGGADKPLGAFWTSSFLPDGSSAWAGVEDVVGTGATRDLWEIHVDVTDIRVFAIDRNEDYVDLVRRFPRPHDDCLAVAWESVATEYDAVHLTAAGLADTHGAVVRHRGRTIALRGWDGECTAWLRFTSGKPSIIPRLRRG